MSLGRILGNRASAARGPSPSFHDAHLLLSFLVIGESDSIGRSALAHSVGLGDGAIRTVLGRLREEGSAEADASGSHLTKSGMSLFRTLRRTITPFVPVEGAGLTLGVSYVALALRAKGKAVRTGLEQRDAAIRVGASGATTYVFRGGKFSIPGGSADCEADFPSRSWAVLRAGLKPKNGDAIVLCGGGDEVRAKVGALAASLTLL